MNFTYSAYRDLLSLLKAKGYHCCDYFDYKDYDKCVILRHDIDYSVERAVKMAELEYQEGVKSTYFVLLRTDFYNPASRHVHDMLQQIRAMGHEVGLHFDEVAHSGCDPEDLPRLIQQEADLLGDLCGLPVRCFSMHRPNQMTLAKDLKVEGLVNSYAQEFFRNFKYLSDSRRNWREPVLDIIKSNEHSRLHILTHAFWYREREESLQKTVCDFICESKLERYANFATNIRNLEEIVSLSDI